MHLLWLTQTCIILFTSLAHAAKLTVSIPSSSLIANPASLPPSTHATLIGSQGVAHDARLTRSNTLNFKDVTPGSYLLSVYTRDYQFPPFRVDVTLNEASTQELVRIWQTFRGNEWNNKGPKFGEGYGEVTISLQPSAKKEFYQQRGGFGVLSFLKSPMILMAVVSLGLVFGMPYLMENMDPETKAEFEEIQKKGPMAGTGGAASQLQNFDLAGWMAGKTSGSQPTQSSSGGQRSIR